MKPSHWITGGNISMSFKFFLTSRFDQAVRRLKKRFPKINSDLEKAFSSIEENPEIGLVIPDDFMIRKLRVSSIDMKRGKSGGFRLLYKLIAKEDNEVRAVLLHIYAKSDQADVSSTFLETLESEIPAED
jgi:mRNA-degrading endonuclease RelE of RelBE toxin-antitoxin system